MSAIDLNVVPMGQRGGEPYDWYAHDLADFHAELDAIVRDGVAVLPRTPLVIDRRRGNPCPQVPIFARAMTALGRVTRLAAREARR